VWRKLLFGSDYPFMTVTVSLAGMRQLNKMLKGTVLPRLDMDEMEKMFHRDSLAALGPAGVVAGHGLRSLPFNAGRRSPAPADLPVCS
jgi:hypothetical protein